MTSERFQEVVRARPFRPLSIHLADGEEIPVSNPEFVSSSPSGRTIVVFQPDDRLSILDFTLITKLEVIPAKSQIGVQEKQL